MVHPIRVWPGALVLAILLIFGQSVAAQTSETPDRLRVLIECRNFSCDMDYLKGELRFVDHVREQAEADVLAILVRQGAGVGGSAYTFRLLGRGAWTAQNIEMRHVAPEGATEHEIRSGIARTLQLGLTPFAAGTGEGDAILVTYEAEVSEESAATTADPWNAWSFRVAAGGSAHGEESYQESNGYAELSAGRVTDRWKVNLAMKANHQKNRFTLDEGRKATYEQSSGGLYALAIRSVGPHWSAGVNAEASQSTYENKARTLSFEPAVEFSVFPYAKATETSLLARYTVGGVYHEYMDETIFGLMEEARIRQSLTLGLTLTQPWGQVSVGGVGGSYVPDLSKNRITAWSYLNVRLFRGLSVEVDATAERIRDQIYLAGTEASEEDILLRQRQLATGFRYGARIGLSYTFGTAFSSVVNPRFGQ